MNLSTILQPLTLKYQNRITPTIKISSNLIYIYQPVCCYGSGAKSCPALGSTPGFFPGLTIS